MRRRRTSRNRILLLSAVVLALAALLSGCGDGEPDAPGEAVATTGAISTSGEDPPITTSATSAPTTTAPPVLTQAERWKIVRTVLWDWDAAARNPCIQYDPIGVEAKLLAYAQEVERMEVPGWEMQRDTIVAAVQALPAEATYTPDQQGCGDAVDRVEQLITEQLVVLGCVRGPDYEGHGRSSFGGTSSTVDAINRACPFAG